MAEIMTDYWKPYLVPTPEDFSNDTPLPTLASLRRRILIKVKYTEPSKEPEKEASNAGGEQDPDTDYAQVEPHGKKGNICYALGSMGVYTRSCHFHSLNQPEAQIPTHVFALPESKVLSLLQEQREALLRHNASFLMRAYPKSTRVSSSNLDPAPFWRQAGVQMVAYVHPPANCWRDKC